MDNVLEFITTRERRDGDVVMFDIDDTLICQKTGKVVPHIKNLLDMCKDLGYKIVIITARPGDTKTQEVTEKQLSSLDIRYDFLGYCDPELKTVLKKHLMKKEGWHFVLSVGDLDTDLTDSDIYLLVQ